MLELFLESEIEETEKMKDLLLSEYNRNRRSFGESESVLPEVTRHEDLTGHLVPSEVTIPEQEGTRLGKMYLHFVAKRTYGLEIKFTLDYAHAL